MYASKWVVETADVSEPVEFPRMLIWKRTLLLGMIGIGIGLGGGYLLGQSKMAKTDAANAAQRPIMRVKFLPIPDADPGEVNWDNEGGAPQTWMPPAADSPIEAAEKDFPPHGKKRPAWLNAPVRNSDKG